MSQLWQKLSLQNGKPPILLKARSSKFYIVTTVALSVFTDLFLYGVIVPVVPFALYSRAGVAEAESTFFRYHSYTFVERVLN